MKVGEPITYVDTVEAAPRSFYPAKYRKGLVRSEVDEVLSYGVFLVTPDGSPFLGPKDEGVRWIRGHHTEQSEIGKALLAAYALSQSVAA